MDLNLPPMWLAYKPDTATVRREYFKAQFQAITQQMNHLLEQARKTDTWTIDTVPTSELFSLAAKATAFASAIQALEGIQHTPKEK